MTELSHDFVSVLWVVLFLLLLFTAWFGKRAVAGLGLCHWFSQATNHFIGEFLVNNSGEDIGNRRLAIVGYQISGIAICGLILGFIAVFFLKRDKSSNIRAYSESENFYAAVLGAIVGFVIYFILMQILSFIPSITAITSGGLPMLAGGIAWLLVLEYYKGGFGKGLFVLLISFLIPGSTLVFKGFLSYGVNSLYAIIGIFFCHLKPRILTVFVVFIMFFLGLSFYPSYMNSREQIREVTWTEASFLEKFTVTFESIFQNWNWFNPYDTNQLMAVNGRLNQNVLVGASYFYLESGSVEYANGETFGNAFLALIPRAIWASKTLNAGSGDLASRYTGITFGKDTSVGIGNMMELLVNFGIIGVFVGYFLIGFSVYYLDFVTGDAILGKDYVKFISYFVPAQSLMNSIGSFQEWGPSLIGSILFSQLFLFYYQRLWGKEILTPSQNGSD